MLSASSSTTSLVPSVASSSLASTSLSLTSTLSVPEEHIVTWDNYIQDMLRSGNICQAAILTLEGDTLASTDGYVISVEECQRLAAAVANPYPYRHSGITVCSHNYKIHLSDGRAIMAKSFGRGCTICRTSRLLIIGIHDQSMCPNTCNEIVMMLGDFFFQKMLWLCPSNWYNALNRKGRDVDEFVFTGCTRSCHVDNWTTFGTDSDAKLVNVTIFLFQCFVSCIP